MAATTPVVSARTARRLLREAQGLLGDPGRRATPGPTPGLVRRTIHQLGYVQVDTINVLERAHHLTLASRLDGYRPAQLDRLLARQRAVFEHWTHDASIIPIEFFPYWKIRFKRYERRGVGHAWWQERIGDDPGKHIRRVLRRIEREGPLRSADFEQPIECGRGWWDWKPDKVALEYLWRSGRLSITRREGFQKVYDLTRRVYPEALALPRPREREHLDWACTEALRRLVIATSTELAAFWRAVTAPEARAWCAAAIRDGRAAEVTVEPAGGGRPWRAVALPEYQDRAAKLPEAPRRIRLLSPFDPVVRDRRRAQRLFAFDYRFEGFTPLPSRRFGYYVLPILEGDRLVGRLDPKLHRDRGELEIKGLWWEPGVKPTRARRGLLDEALQRLAGFVGAERVVLPCRPRGLDGALSREAARRLPRPGGDTHGPPAAAPGRRPDRGRPLPRS